MDCFFVFVFYWRLTVEAQDGEKAIQQICEANLSGAHDLATDLQNFRESSFGPNTQIPIAASHGDS